MLALIFTVMLVFIMLSGSLWVMYHLNHNMMPGMMQETVPASLQVPMDGPVMEEMAPMHHHHGHE